jgi:hypothetical protein
MATLTIKLSEAEVLALSDEAQTQLIDAGERLRWYDREKCGGSPEEAHARETERMMAAAEVYGACRNVELRFGTEPVEAAEVGFTRRALDWLMVLRGETRDSLEDARGSVEIDPHSSPGQMLLLFVLDGIAAEAVA